MSWEAIVLLILVEFLFITQPVWIMQEAWLSDDIKLSATVSQFYIAIPITFCEIKDSRSVSLIAELICNYLISRSTEGILIYIYI